jgi:hypothetical protein
MIQKILDALALAIVIGSFCVLVSIGYHKYAYEPTINSYRTPETADTPIVVQTTSTFYESRKSIQCEGKSISEMQESSTLGRSMLPSINSQETILWIKYNKTLPIVPGDIVNADETLHRVTGVYKDYFLMKGDNNYIEDAKRYTYENITYVVCGTLKN